MNNSEKHKVIVIGAGAAGMMAAIAAAEEGKSVVILEKNEKAGKKIFITGKGRCNLTTACPSEEFLSNVVTNPKFLYSSFENFTNQDMMRWVQERGLKIKVERGQRVFPQSDHSSDVIRVLEQECRRLGVRITYHAQVEEILTEDLPVSEETEGKKSKKPIQTKHFLGVRLDDGKMIKADSLIIATGGKSYQATGSTGDGYHFAREIGHKIKEPQPSLVPFTVREGWPRSLQGLSLRNISIKIKHKKKILYEGFGEFLFTHFGVSGPLVLTASTQMGGKNWKLLNSGELVLNLDLKPALDMETLERRFLREFDTFRNKNVANVTSQLLPKKMVKVFLNLVEIPEDKKVRDITKEERRRMVETMKDIPMHLTGVRGFSEAIVTRGGVSTREVNPTTMESKLARNVYFAGEVLDVDAVTGGFNLQIAWSTGRTAGHYA